MTFDSRNIICKWYGRQHLFCPQKFIQNHPSKCVNMHKNIPGYSQGSQNAFRCCVKKGLPVQRREKAFKNEKEKSLIYLLQVLAEGGNDSTDGHTDGGQAKANDDGSDLGGELDEEHLAIVAGDGEQTLDGAREVRDEVANVASGLDDRANGATNGSQAKTVNESGNLGRELDQELLGVGAGDGEDLADGGDEVLDDLAGGSVTLERGTESSNDGADRDADGGEAEAGKKAGNLGGEGDQESTDISANNGDEAVDGRAETSDELAQGAGGGNDGAKRDAQGGETKARDEGSDLRAQLEEQSLGVRASDGQDVVELRGQVLEDVAVLGNGGVAGGSNVAQVEDGGQVTELGDDGEAVQVQLLGDIAKAEVLGEAIKTTQVGDGGSDASQTGEGGEAGGSGGGSGGQGEESSKGNLHGVGIQRMWIIKRMTVVGMNPRE